MFKEEDFPKRNGINRLIDLYEKIITEKGALDEVNLIDQFFTPLRTEINEGRYDYKLVKAWNSATNLLDLKVQELFSRALQRDSQKEQESLDTRIKTISDGLHLGRPIAPLPRKISKDHIIKAYIELMINRRKKRNYDVEPERMGYNPVDIEPVSIEADKEKILRKIQQFKKASIDFRSLLAEKTWQEVLEILNILLHLAHEQKIKLFQENFPDGKIIIINQEKMN